MRVIDSVRRTSSGDIVLAVREELGPLAAGDREALVAVDRSLVVLDAGLLAAERGCEVVEKVTWAAFGGRVLEAGPLAVIRPGTRVCGVGPAGARVRCDAGGLRAVPPDLDAADEPRAALILALVEAVRRHALELGESAAIVGRGVPAAALTAMVARTGVRLAAWAGADAPADAAAEHGLAPVLRCTTMEALVAARPEPFDALFVVQQSTRELLESLALLRSGGRVLAIAGDGPPSPDAADLYVHAHRRSLRLTAATFGGLLRGLDAANPRSLDLCLDPWTTGNGAGPLRRTVTVDVRAGATALRLPIETEHLVMLAWHGADG